MNDPRIDLLDTMALCAALKTLLAGIDHPTLAGQKLFEVVDYHENKSLAEALQDLIIVKKRIALIVPQGDRYQPVEIGRAIAQERTTSLDLVFADKAYLKGGNDAAFGSEKTLGVIAMKEIVTRTIAADPQLGGLRWCALAPVEGAILELAADEKKSAPGRLAWVQNYETPSGRIQSPVKTAWQPSA